MSDEQKTPWVLAAERVAKEGWGTLPERVNVSVVVFTYDKTMHADLLDYIVKLYGQMLHHPRINILRVATSTGYPTDRARNAAVKQAKEDGSHYALFLDNDNTPDYLLGRDAGAKPFLPTALEFALAHDGPCFVGAPYCSGPPAQEVVVMKHREYIPDLVGGLGKKLDKFTRDEAAVATGTERVAALPTGCLLMDLRAFDVLPPPWFYYEFKDPPYNTQLASTEDVACTRNADWLGIPQFCNWDAWAGHWKAYQVEKPRPCPVDSVPRAIWEAFKAGAKPRLTTPSET